MFLPKIVTQSPIFFTLSRILEIFHSKTPNRLEFEKKVPKCPLFLWLLPLKDPLFLPCIHMFVSGECCSLKHSQKLENFAFLKQNRAIWRILSGANLIKGAEKKMSVLQAQPTQLCIMDEFHWRAQMIYRLLSLLSNTEGIYPTTTLYKSAQCTWLSKQMPSVPEDVRAEAF